MVAWAGGKGSGARSVDRDRFSANWDLIWGKKNMNRDEIVDILHNNIANITFTKVNGDVRVLKGTLLDQYLPQKEVDSSGVDIEPISETQERKATNDNVVVAFDIDNDGYRSFRVDSVTSVQIVE